MAAVVVRVDGRGGTNGTVVAVAVFAGGWVVGVDVIVVAVGVGRGVVVDEGLRSQGFGGDACMSKDLGRGRSR